MPVAPRHTVQGGQVSSPSCLGWGPDALPLVTGWLLILLTSQQMERATYSLEAPALCDRGPMGRRAVLHCLVAPTLLSRDPASQAGATDPSLPGVSRCTCGCMHVIVG